jgi:hypothetical protein
LRSVSRAHRESTNHWRRKHESNILGFVARRPDYGKEEILNREDLKNLAHHLAHLSLSAVREIYERAYRNCQITSREFPAPRAIQELVQAWKQLRKWR